jgi:hypothetical protein
MRTTIILNDDLHRRAKEYAARNHRTLTSVIETALRYAIRSRTSAAPGRKVKIPTGGSGGVAPGDDLLIRNRFFLIPDGRPAYEAKKGYGGHYR